MRQLLDEKNSDFFRQMGKNHFLKKHGSLLLFLHLVNGIQYNFDIADDGQRL